MIKTVLGAVSPTEIQKVLMHEHIACVSKEMAAVFGEVAVDRLQKESCLF